MKIYRSVIFLAISVKIVYMHIELINPGDPLHWLAASSHKFQQLLDPLNFRALEKQCLVRILSISM